MGVAFADSVYTAVFDPSAFSYLALFAVVYCELLFVDGWCRQLHDELYHSSYNMERQIRAWKWYDRNGYLVG
jgi:hypothetical protein